jgi:hypothetical protein
VASVGLTEKKAKERGYEVKTGTFPFSAVLKAKIRRRGIGMIKVVSDKKYDEVLGVHMVGPPRHRAPRRGLRRAAAGDHHPRSWARNHPRPPHASRRSSRRAQRRALGTPIHI